MPILFATLGFTPELVIQPLKIRANIEKLIFYYDEGTEESISAKEEVIEYCRNINLNCEAKGIPNVFDLIACVKIIKEDIKTIKVQGKEIDCFAISGGTRILSSSALLSCILEGIPCIHISEKTGEEIPLPLLKIEYNKILTPKEIEIIRTIKKFGMTDFKSLRNELKLSKATMSFHLKELKKKGIVKEIVSKEDTRKKFYELESSAELLVE